MKLFSKLLGDLQFAASKSAFCVQLAIKVRNQMNRVLSLRMGESADPESNGELALITFVAPKCERFVDVGANVGNWTSLFLSYSRAQCQGLLFEPGEEAFQALNGRFENLNNIQIVNQAVGDEIGHLDFYEEQSAGEGSSLLGQTTSVSAHRKKVIVTTLDLEMTRCGWDSIDYLKIDTEGYDYYVLRGATNLLGSGRIGIIQFEYNSHWIWASATLAGAVSLLEQYGYICYLVRSNGLFRLDHANYGEYFSYSNFVAVHKDREIWIHKLFRGYV